jgi:hypothetical protein
MTRDFQVKRTPKDAFSQEDRERHTLLVSLNAEPDKRKLTKRWVCRFSHGTDGASVSSFGPYTPKAFAENFLNLIEEILGSALFSQPNMEDLLAADDEAPAFNSPPTPHHAVRRRTLKWPK